MASSDLTPTSLAANISEIKKSFVTRAVDIAVVAIEGMTCQSCVKYVHVILIHQAGKGLNELRRWRSLA